MTGIRAGWYDDPAHPGTQRYHDGHSWTDHRRGDLPDIPLAPWVRREGTSAPIVDTVPPRSGNGWLMPLLAGAVGIAAVTAVGVTTTLGALRADGDAASPARPTASPTPGSEPVVALWTCAELGARTVSFGNSEGDLPLTGWAPAPEVVEDSQPIWSLPPAGERYLVLACQGRGLLPGGTAVEVGMVLTVTSDGDLLLDYGTS